MDDLERHFILMQEFLGAFLQRQQFVGAQIAFVVGSSLAGENRFFQISHVFVSSRKSVALTLRWNPLRIIFGLHYGSIAHVNDAISVAGGLGIVSDHQYRLAEFLVGVP